MLQTIDRFVTDRGDLARARWESVPAEALPEGAVRVRLDAFALTANNITYAAFGEAMNYWAFFPTGDAAMGCVPVWGFASVVESRCDEVAAGERLYGYWPIASHVTLRPAQVRASGFTDASAHRAALPALYNRYRRCAADAGYDAAREAEQALLQPLFGTGFLIDDFLREHAFFGAAQVVLTSASSKTALATAFCLARAARAQPPARPEPAARPGPPEAAATGAPAVATIGLTSAAHAAHVRGLGAYARVLGYDAIDTLAADVPTVLVDFNGSPAVRAAVHRRFGERLRYSCAVGVTDWAAFGAGQGQAGVEKLPGPRPVFFFAPAQIDKRAAEWGAATLQARIGEAWAAFLQRVADPARPWLRVVHGRGPGAIAEVYAALVAGRADPASGHFLHLA